MANCSFVAELEVQYLLTFPIFFVVVTCLQLRAMSEALSTPMEVVQAEGPNVTVGEDYSGTPITLV